MEQTNNLYDVFLSYHGGNIDGGSSSYKKAEELKRFFENHPGKKLKCFLCKAENHDDFYDAINEALIQAKHFVLVACDGSMLSKWVADELKQFDGMRKIGKKPNAVINAYIFGAIKVDDLLNFNTVFSTKDIAFGEQGFESLYNMIAEKECIQDKKLCFEYSNKAITKFVYAMPLSHRFNMKINKYFSVCSTQEEVSRKFTDDVTSFEAYCAEKLCLLLSQNTDAFILLRVLHPVCVAEYLLSSEFVKNLNVLLLDYQSDSAVLLVDGSSIAFPTLYDMKIVFSNEIIRVDANEHSKHNPVLFNTNNGALELPTSDYNEFGDISYYERQVDEFAWNEVTTDISNTKFCLYLLNALYDNIVPKGTTESEELFNDIDFCSIELTETYEPVKIEKQIIIQKEKSIVKLENLLLNYYRSIKNGTPFGQSETKELFSSKYSNIAYNLKNYYTRHSIDILLDVLNKLFDYAIAEKENGFYSRYEYLILIISEIYLHNIFTLDYQFMVDRNIYKTLVNLYNCEYIIINKNKLNALICSYRKEIYFCGKFEQLEITDSNTSEALLGEFEQIISLMESSCADMEDNEYKSELFLLYRERSVIWEHCGDMTLKQSERKAFYTNAKNDCERALQIGTLIDCDKELQGCIYLNLASSINRLSVHYKDRKLDMLNECLKCLDNALEVLKICATDRFIAYVYLNKSECHEAILNENIAQQGKFDVSAMSDTVDEIRRNSTHALNFIKGTSDDLAKTWALRLSVKGKLLNSNNYGSVETIKTGMKTLRESLKLSMASNYVICMAACIKDFTFYNELITKEGIQNELTEEIEQTFCDEMLAFASIVKLLKLDLGDIVEVQQQLKKLVEKLTD